MTSRLGQIGGWEVDLPGRQVTWTDELCAIHDLPSGFRPTFEQALAFYLPQHRLVMQQAFAACSTEGTPFDVEVDLTTSSGRRIHGRSIGEAVRDDTGRIYRVQGALQDVSERRRAQEEIHQLAERLGTTLDSITDALVTVDRNWNITFMNREAEHVLQRPRALLLGANMWDEFPEGRESVFDHQYRLALRENRTVEFEAFFEPLQAWLELRVYPSPQGGLTIYFRDVTERRASRRQILELNTQLEHRVRERTAQLEVANHELGAFSYSVAHDLRAPLAAISGFSQALEHELAAGMKTTEKSRHYLARMRAGLHQTHEMIDAMLALSQLSQTELRWNDVDLAAMARSAFANLRQQEPQRTATLHLDQPLPATGDPRLLQLVLDNLIGNAWKFSGGGDGVDITVGMETGTAGEPVFFVRDQGVGFDMEYAGKLFGAFQRLHSQAEFPGTGVGLANVWRIVTRHGGRVWARSAPGAGATFYFTLGQLPAQ
ncbi:MAG: domain S-box protein [Ramlibacter sp.]|nr:domain S-box protein [Ramlibacter sp.]